MESTLDTSEYLHTRATGYMVNTLLSQKTQQQVASIQATFEEKFPRLLWLAPPDALHVTLLDWLAPLIAYSRDKDDLYNELLTEYDTAMNTALIGSTPLNVHFNKLFINPSAIALVADDKSTKVFNDIRNAFLDRVDLLPDTKQPPTIVHTTIARFIGTIALDDVRTYAQSLDVSLYETVREFQLVREATLPMLDYSVMKKYPLAST